MNLTEIKDKFISEKKRNAMEYELMSAMAYVRNIVILGRGESISAETLMGELADVCTVLKPAFQDMAHYLNINDIKTAEGILYKNIKTGVSKDLGRFLADWDKVPPAQLLRTVEIYTDSLREDNLIKRQKNDELMSDLIYFPVVLNAMLVLLDFVYVAFFIEQQTMLNNLI